MGQRGRKSSAELAVASTSTLPARATPPPGLPERAAQVWRATVAAMRADWFTGEHWPLLAAYCRHLARAEDMHRRADDHDGPVEELDRLLRMAEREDRAALALARSLRLTRQSQTDPKRAGNCKREIPTIDFTGVRRPWTPPRD